MLLGHTLIDLISEPDWFNKGGFENRYYAPSEKHPDGGDVRVLGYRKLTEEEKMEWVQKVEAINLPDLVEIIKSS